MSGSPSDGRPGAGRASRLRWAAGTVAAVVAGAALAGAFVAGRYEARLGLMARETAALRHRLERDVAALAEAAAAAREAVELLRDPRTEVVPLRGRGPGAGATGRAVWNAARGGHLLVAALPRPPAGRAYALWALGAGAPRPAGVLRVGDAGRATLRLAPDPAGRPVTGFAVTLEPEGDAAVPTGPTVLASR